MPPMSNATVLGHLYQTAGAAALATLPDGELLKRFTAGGGAAEAAFTALLYRHGPSVLRVCRAILRDGHDAEDAFQATFLVLAAKARSLRLRGPLGLWLYGVARRVALQARSAAARRRRHEQGAAKAERAPIDPVEPDLAGVVLEAVSRLPERFRATVILCDLEGLTYAEAADRLGWTHTAVRNRLARGRDRLRIALSKKGLAPMTALAAGAVAPVPRALATTTARAATCVANGSIDGVVPAGVIALVNGGLRTMLLMKLKTVGLTLLAGAALVAGAHGLTARAPTERPESTHLTADPPAAAQANPAPARPRAAADSLVAKLNMTVTIDKPIENAPLKDVLEFLSDKYEVTFIVDVMAFDQHHGNRQVEDAQVRLPKMSGVTLQTVLRYVLGQVQGKVLVRNDHLEITTVTQASLEAYGDPRTGFIHQRQLHPLVNVACDRRPLERALADIAEQSGLNVVLDSRVTDREKLVVTTKLLNTPTDTAVRVLAELCNLKSVQMDNVFFVTTRVRAAELQMEQAELAKGRAPVAGTPATPAPAKP